MSLQNMGPAISRRSLTFTDIYHAIEAGDDFNEPQLFYLSRLVERKLKRFDSRLDFRDLEMKPYEQ